MGRKLALFVSPAASSHAEHLVDAVRAILVNGFEEVAANDTQLTLRGEHVFVDVEPAEGYEDDRDMPFSQFDSVVWIEPKRQEVSRLSGSDNAVARQLFDALRDSGQFRLLLTDDMQHLLDRHEPEVEERTD